MLVRESISFRRGGTDAEIKSRITGALIPGQAIESNFMPVGLRRDSTELAFLLDYKKDRSGNACKNGTYRLHQFGVLNVYTTNGGILPRVSIKFTNKTRHIHHICREFAQPISDPEIAKLIRDELDRQYELGNNEALNYIMDRYEIKIFV